MSSGTPLTDFRLKRRPQGRARFIRATVIGACPITKPGIAKRKWNDNEGWYDNKKLYDNKIGVATTRGDRDVTHCLLGG